MPEDSNRRRFERLPVENTIARDEQQQIIGDVELAGGGGMQIRLPSATASPDLGVGRRTRLNIYEKATKITLPVDVIVRFRKGDCLGVEFVTGNQK